MGISKKAMIYFDDYGSLEVVHGTVSHSFPLHTHKSDCYLEITEGNAQLYCNGTVELSAGQMQVIPANVPHTLTMVNGQPYSYRTVCVKNLAQEYINSEDKFLTDAREYLEHTAPGRFDLEGMAKYLHYSKFHLIRKFKSCCGLSPYQYYSNMRIEKIRQGLLFRHPLPDLALELGFAHQSHLCNTFKQYMGITPTQYRQQYTNHASAGANNASI